MKPKPKNANDDDTLVATKLEKVIQILQDLFILEAVRAGMGRDGITDVLGVHTSRISRIRKHLE